MLEASGANDERWTVCVGVTQLQVCFAVVTGLVHHNSLWAVWDHVDPAEEHISVGRVKVVPGDLCEDIWDLSVSWQICGGCVQPLYPKQADGRWC